MSSLSSRRHRWTSPSHHHLLLLSPRDCLMRRERMNPCRSSEVEWTINLPGSVLFRWQFDCKAFDHMVLHSSGSSRRITLIISVPYPKPLTVFSLPPPRLLSPLLRSLSTIEEKPFATARRVGSTEQPARGQRLPWKTSDLLTLSGTRRDLNFCYCGSVEAAECWSAESNCSIFPDLGQTALFVLIDSKELQLYRTQPQNNMR